MPHQNEQERDAAKQQLELALQQHEHHAFMLGNRYRQFLQQVFGNRLMDACEAIFEVMNELTLEQIESDRESIIDQFLDVAAVSETELWIELAQIQSEHYAEILNYENKVIGTLEVWLDKTIESHHYNLSNVRSMGACHLHRIGYTDVAERKNMTQYYQVKRKPKP